MTRVKICGLTRGEDVAAAVEAGADAVGFVCGFPESPRSITPSRVRELMQRVPPFVETVLVTRSDFIRGDPETVRLLKPSALQLYGPTGEVLGLREKIEVKLILPYLVDGHAGAPPGSGFDAILSDTHRKGGYGGTGEVSDWGACRRLKEAISPTPFILSGGLNQANVAKAIAQVHPYAVDVSSGVEKAPGVKDRAKVKAFIQAAMEAG